MFNFDNSLNRNMKNIVIVVTEITIMPYFWHYFLWKEVFSDSDKCSMKSDRPKNFENYRENSLKNI